MSDAEPGTSKAVLEMEPEPRKRLKLKKKKKKKKRRIRTPKPLLLRELLENILQFLDFETLKGFRVVNKYWNKVACDILRRRSVLRIREYNLSGAQTTKFLQMLNPPTMDFPEPFQNLDIEWGQYSYRTNHFQFIYKHMTFKKAIISLDFGGFISYERRLHTFNTLVFPHAGTLEVLKLYGCIGLDDEMTKVAKSLVFPKLHTLHLKSRKFADDFGAPLELQEEEGDPMEAAWLFIEACPSIKELHLEFRFECRDEIQQFDETHVQRLIQRGWVHTTGSLSDSEDVGDGISQDALEGFGALRTFEKPSSLR